MGASFWLFIPGLVALAEGLLLPLLWWPWHPKEPAANDRKQCRGINPAQSERVLKIGRHSGEEYRPYDNGSGALGRALLAFLAWWHGRLFGQPGESGGNAGGRTRGIGRSRRWLVCWSLGIITLLISALITFATVQASDRDFAVVSTQGVEQGVLIEDDYSACRMDIDLHGQKVSAESSCNTNASFPAGTKISVVSDPADVDRYLVVSPGQDWHEATSENVWVGMIVGLIAAATVVSVGYRLLLHGDRHELPHDRGTAKPTDAPRPYGNPGVSAALDRFGESWESRKEAAGKGWFHFVDMDVRIRGSILGALVVAVTGALIVLGSGSNAELAYDRALARTEPVVDTTLLDFGGKGMNPTVRFDIKAVELAHGLRWEIFRNVGETIPVVEDPQIPDRLIPVEFADSRGLWGILWDNVPMVIAWIAIVGFLGWMFIPRELAAVGEAYEKFMRGGKSTGRH